MLCDLLYYPTVYKGFFFSFWYNFFSKFLEWVIFFLISIMDKSCEVDMILLLRNRVIIIQFQLVHNEIVLL